MTSLNNPELRIKGSSEYFRRIVENSNDLIRVLNDELIIEYINAVAHEESIGYYKEDLIGKKATILIHLDDYTETRRFMLKVYKKGEGVREGRIKSKNGDFHWFEIKGKSFLDAEGNLKLLFISRDISARKIAEENLKKSEGKLKTLNKELEGKISERTKEFKDSEEQLKLITEQTIAGIILIQDGYIKYVNEALIQMTGYRRDALLKWASYDFFNKIHPEDRTFVMEQMRKRLTGKEEVAPRYSCRIIKKSDEIRWIELYSKVIIFQGKTSDLVTLIDITERMKIAEELKKSEHRYKDLFDKTPYSIILLTLKGIIIDVNHTIEELLGYSRQELIKEPLFELGVFKPENIPLLRKRLVLYQKGETLEPIEIQIFKKDKSLVWISPIVAIVKLGKETFIQIVVLNITAKKEAERMLKESEEKFRTIADQSLLGIAIVQNGFTKYVNDALASITGYSKKEMKKQRRNAFIRSIHPNDLPLVLEKIQEFTKLKSKSSMHYSHQIISKSGKVKWIETYSKKIIYRGADAQLSTMVDITEQKIAEEKLLQSEKRLLEQNLELKELDQLKNDFITIAAHELKTPLVSVKGYVELILMQDNNLDDETIENLEIIENNAEKLRLYIEQLMDVMKIDANKINLMFSEKNISSLIKNCIKTCEIQLNKKKLKIITDINKDLKLMVDPVRIAQVFNNLIMNAIKFTPEEGQITISAEESDGQVLFKVLDTGIGLPKEAIGRLFQKFVTLYQNPDNFSRIERGSGLGLYITKGIIEAHGGKIWVQSRGVNQGSEFSFTLPKHV